MSDKIIVVGDIFGSNGMKSMAGRIYDPFGLAPTLGGSHFQQIKYIIERNGTEKPNSSTEDRMLHRSE